MKKHLLTRLLALMLAATLLAGCELPFLNGSQDQDITDEPPVTTGESPEHREARQRERLYKYLLNTVVPEQGLARLEEITWTHSSVKGGVTSNLGFLEENGYYGILSAVVRDFDFDGNQDLVVFRLTGAPQNEIWAPIFNPEHQWDSYVIAVDLYTIDGWGISLSDSYPHLMTLDGLSWGFLQVSLEQLEDGIYIQANSDAQDYNTYGASPSSIFHIANGKFVFDYLSGIRYGQASYDGDPNEVLGTTGLKPREYTFFSLSLPHDQVDPKGDPRENRYVLHIDVKNDEDDYKKLHYTATDYTGLRIIAQDGVDAFPHAPLPQGGKKPEDTGLRQYEAIGQAFIDHIVQQSGCEIVDSYASRSESAGTVDFTWKTKGKTSILLRLNSDGSFRYISLSSPEWKDMNDFISVKDAILDYPQLGLDPEAVRVFKGKVHSKYLNGYQVPGAELMMGIVADTMFRIEFE